MTGAAIPREGPPVEAALPLDSTAQHGPGFRSPLTASRVARAAQRLAGAGPGDPPRVHDQLSVDGDAGDARVGVFERRAGGHGLRVEERQVGPEAYLDQAAQSGIPAAWAAKVILRTASSRRSRPCSRT